MDDPGHTRVVVQNVNHPGNTREVDAEHYDAVRGALLAILPQAPPGMTLDEIRAELPNHLPEELFPGGRKAGWWLKTVQLDLEAKGVLVRSRTSPLRLTRRPS
jgi:hypothetical protein